VRREISGCILVRRHVKKNNSTGSALMMEAARTSETLVHFNQTTRRYNPEDSHLRTHRRKNLKSYLFTLFVLGYGTVLQLLNLTVIQFVAGYVGQAYYTQSTKRLLKRR
jgi:hypothetical protein